MVVQESIQVGQTTTARAVAVMSDGTRRDFPAGTKFAFVLTDGTVASFDPTQTLNDTCALTGTRVNAVAEISVIATTPDGKKWSPTAPRSTLMVLQHPATEPTITGAEIRFE